MPFLKTFSARCGLSVLILSVATLAAVPAFALTSDPDDTFEPAFSLEGNYLSAYVAGIARDMKAASSFYRQAIADDPRNQDLLERAFVAFLTDGSMNDAFRAAERIVARDPSNSLAQFALSVRALKAGRFAEARAILAKGEKRHRPDITSTLLSAWAEAGAHKGKAALETVDRLKDDKAFSQISEYHAALIAQFIGRPDEAEKRFKTAYEDERNTLQVVDAYARFEARRGHKDMALEIYKTFQEAMPRHPVVRTTVDAIKTGKPLPLSITRPQDGAAEVLYGLGVAGGGQGDELTAIIYLRLGLYLEPDHPLALVTLGDTYEKLKQYEIANEIFARVPKDAPVRLSTDISIGQNMDLLGQSSEAISYLEKLEKEHPDDSDVLIALGNVQRSGKQFAQAAETYSKAIDRANASDPGNWLLYFYRGTSYERANAWDKAEPDLKKAVDMVPETLSSGRAQVMNYLAYSWVDRALNIDEAFKMLQRAVELSPRDGMIIDSLGWAYYRLGRYDDAVRELEKAVDLKAGDPTINDHLGDAYWRVGRKLEAKFQWNHAKDSNPEHDDLVKILKKIDNGLDETAPAAEAVPAAPNPPPAQNGG